jgi:hypothetical protein
MAIENVIISNTNTVLLTVPVGKRYAITTILVCNTWTPNPISEVDGLTNFDMHFVKNGEPKSDTNMVIKTLQMPAGETFTFDSEKIILEEGDRIILSGDSPNNLSATVSYLEV